MQQVAEALCRAIHRMAALEEDLFFPAARAALEASSLVDIAEEARPFAAETRLVIAEMPAFAACTTAPPIRKVAPSTTG